MLTRERRKEEIVRFNKENGGICKYDDRMMNNSCLNIHHNTLIEPYISIKEYNARLLGSNFN